MNAERERRLRRYSGREREIAFTDGHRYRFYELRANPENVDDFVFFRVRDDQSLEDRVHRLVTELGTAHDPTLRVHTDALYVIVPARTWVIRMWLITHARDVPLDYPVPRRRWVLKTLLGENNVWLGQVLVDLKTGERFSLDVCPEMRRAYERAERNSLYRKLEEAEACLTSTT